MLIDPPSSSLAAGWDLPRRRPRYVARIRIRPKAVQPRPAATEPLSCWHVWLTDGLVPGVDAAAASFGALFDRAERVAAERAAAYRAHEAEATVERPRFDVRA